uniref:Uncharacterized protein n=1 Tax=Panagrolaimus sp. JU765 TaxID=591449 RepID=A0AC34QLH0_9BILA
MDQSQHSTTGYRIGSVGHDTQLLLWDIGDDILTNIPANLTGNKNVGPTTISVGLNPVSNEMNSLSNPDHGKSPSSDAPSLTSTSSTKSKLKKLHKRGFSFGNRLSRAVGVSTNQQQNGYINGHAVDNKDSSGVFGSPICPKLRSIPMIEPFLNKKIAHERLTDSSGVFGSPICPKLRSIPMIEPFLNKKIAHERLTVLFFREECIVTGCQEGFICTWARPGRDQLKLIQAWRELLKDMQELMSEEIPLIGSVFCDIGKLVDFVSF